MNMERKLSFCATFQGQCVVLGGMVNGNKKVLKKFLKLLKLMITTLTKDLISLICKLQVTTQKSLQNYSCHL